MAIICIISQVRLERPRSHGCAKVGSNLRLILRAPRRRYIRKRAMLRASAFRKTWKIIPGQTEFDL